MLTFVLFSLFSMAQNPPSAIDREVIFWKTIESSKNLDDFRVYLQQYPRGIYVALARARIRTALDQFLAEPASASEAPSLDATMKFVQDTLNGMGKMTWQKTRTMIVQPGWAGSGVPGSVETDWFTQSKTISGAVATLSGCTLSYHSINEDSHTSSQYGNMGVTRSDGVVRASLLDVATLDVYPYDTDSKPYTWEEDKTSPPEVALIAHSKPGTFSTEQGRTTDAHGQVKALDLKFGGFTFTFQNEGQAQQMKKAIAHAVELCGGDRIR